ncbi:MAG: alkene reductase [Alphaproteobacteria bacterium]|nr:alkene reductase [Alphaproteobacteria bacterium]
MNLFSKHDLGPATLKNRVVMAPMTRCRAIDNIPGDLMVDYYAQRASAGLIITEGTAPSANGLGYPRIPGLFSEDQVAGWRRVTDAVHAAGGTIFAQLMHTGRIAHPLNMPEGSTIVAPSAVAAAGTMFTDTDGMQPHPVPKEMDAQDIAQAIDEFVGAAKNAIAAGFDGIELHAANGYLLEQFLNPDSNQRTDGYGGTADKRSRFVLEVAEAVSKAIGADRVGIRFSPHGTFNDIAPYEGVADHYGPLAEKLQEIGLVYVHLVLGQDGLPETTLHAIRNGYHGTLMVNTGFDRTGAETTVGRGDADLISFGVPFIANPDLVERMQTDTPLADPQPDLFYAPGAEGYVDYPKAS